MKFELVHELPRDADTAWRLLMSDDYEAASSASTKIDREVVESRVDGGVRVRRSRITSERELPGPIAKVVGAKALSYEMIETFDDANRTSTWEVIPSKLADRVTAKGTYVIEPGPKPDESVRRISGEVVVKVALVGKKIEDLIGNEVRASYDKSTAFARDYLRTH